MIHRRILMDDARGVDQPLNQLGLDGKGLVQVVRHFVVYGNYYRQTQQQNDQKIATTFMDTTIGIFSKKSPAPTAISVPSNVKLYIRPFTDGTYLVRLQNFDLSAATVNLPAGWDATEYTLSANQLLSTWKSKQYKWNLETSQ